MDLDANESQDERPIDRAETITLMIEKHCDCIRTWKNVTTNQFLKATAQLCHRDTDLAEQVWLQLFPKLWEILDEDQRDNLIQEIIPFVVSGTHIIQKDCHPSSINTFVEALCRCSNLSIQIEPPLAKYLGKSHNLWHRMALGLEQVAFDPTANSKANNPYDFEADQSKNELLDLLGELYSSLCEEDLWAGESTTNQ